jgi:hypothetical protein
VAVLARRAQIPGEHFPFRESLITGPVLEGEEWIETRTRALAARYNEDHLRIRTELLEQDQALAAAPAQGEIVLWFEHDLFCLVHLIHLLQRFGDVRLSLIWCPTPLGMQEEREISLLFESRAAVMPSMIATAREAWRAYTSSDPTALNRWLERETPDFPFLREGMTLHASRFPSIRNGLGAIEQRALELIAAGTTDFAALFDRINESARFGFGDSEVIGILKSMATRAVPLITMGGEAPKLIYSITPAGENVLRGEVDDCKVNDPDHWLGGAHLTKETLWRFDGSRIIPSRPAVS